MPTPSTRTIGIIRFDETDDGRHDIEESDGLATVLNWLIGEHRVTSLGSSPSRPVRIPTDAASSFSQISPSCPPRIQADLAAIAAELHDEYQQLTI